MSIIQLKDHWSPDTLLVIPLVIGDYWPSDDWPIVLIIVIITVLLVLMMTNDWLLLKWQIVWYYWTIVIGNVIVLLWLH